MDGYLKKEKSMFDKMEEDWLSGSYFYPEEWLFDNGYINKEDAKLSGKTIKQCYMYYDISYLSSNGTRPVYLNPKQAAFVNEWGGGKNEQTTKNNT